jgi:hypothetical protein
LLVLAGFVVGCGDDGGGGAASTDGSSSGGGDVVGTTTGAEDTGPPMVGQPPPTPQIVSPANGDTEVGTENGDLVSVDLCWTPVEDPEGNRVRYRVWLDSIELTEGKIAEEPGFEGPCLGPLDMLFDSQHAWQVQAFEADFLDPDGLPTSVSGLSPAATFRTLENGEFTVVFEDDFEDGPEWTVGGDAVSGDWVYGDPDMAMNGPAVSQPNNCAGGTGCWFTGFNPGGDPSLADVLGGTTTLTSPPFDLSPYATATVEISRFFYKEIFPETGTLFRVELLVPDASAPNGEQVFVLEQLEGQVEAGNANTWMPVEFAACGVPMASATEARLRIVATDLGEGITEAAIDNVTVNGFLASYVCDGGAGSICDPNGDACADDLLCCAQGTVNKGVYRCEAAAAAMSFPDGGAGAMGCNAPDLFATDVGMDVWEDDLFVDDNSCLLYEACVDGPGARHLLRFDTITPNAGAADLIMGVPTNHPDLFHYSECHGHYHFDGYAVYDLLDTQGNVVAVGHKQAFCLLDWNAWDVGNPGSGYGCSNQGISAGWQDVYSGNLDCNWIDVTDTPPGDYILRISINPPPEGMELPLVIETTYDNNVLEVPVTLAG